MITLVTPQFCKVGETGKALLADIKCSNEMIGQVYLSTLAEDGQLLETYDWSVDDNDNPCWVDEGTGSPAEDIEFTTGQAFWIQCDAEDVGNIMSAGQVSTDDVTIELNGGSMITLVGNSSPVDISLNDVLCPNEMIGQVYLSTLAEDGQLLETYDWSVDDNDNPCWVDEGTGSPAEDINLIAGQAFWIQCDAEEGGTITFPGVELK